MTVLDSPRNGKPYVWVTWITGLLAGTDYCRWKAWYRSHYRYAKLPREDGDIDAWKLQHDEMTSDRVDTLREDGWRVDVEEANAFQLHGRAAILAGKPDILARRDDPSRALVIDNKSGTPKPSDEWQVLLYMFALPASGAIDVPMAGEVQYRGSSVAIPASRLDAGAKASIVATMRMVGDLVAPKRTPSQRECQFCDIAACPERIEIKPTVSETEYF